ncbi:hypothetical protein ACFLY1_00695 [Patescibacteria group bacterium]
MFEGKITGLEALFIALVISIVVSGSFIIGTRISKGKWIFGKDERKKLPQKNALNNIINREG